MRWRREAVADGARRADRRDRVGREPFDALVEGLRLPRALRARVAHPVGERGEAADLGLLARRDLAQPLLVLGARAEVLRVGALVLAQVAFVEVQHLRDRLVEQLEVVAHDEQRAAVRAEEAHQPFLGVDVEVVGGLVEHQVLGAAEQDARELDPAPLATGERGEREQGAVGGEAEAGEDPVHVGLGPVAARVAEGLLGVREAADRPLAGVVFHVAAEHLELVALGVEAAGRQHVRHGDVFGAVAIGARVLGQEAERAGDGDPAARRRALAAERAEQRGLARAVATDEPDLVARVHRERRVVDEHALGDFDRQFLSADHGCRRYRLVAPETPDIRRQCARRPP